MSPTDDKTPFRENAKAHRRTLARAAGPDTPVRLKDAFMAAAGALGLEAGAPVAAYWPLADEMDVRPLMAALDEAGFAVALPVVTGADAPLVFRRWEPDTVLEAGAFGTAHPGADAETLTPRFIIVPLLAFDRAGHRIGYGGGFYDRTLAVLRGQGPVTAIGAAFAGQEAASVPHGAGDEPLDGVVTEAGMIHIEATN